MPQLFRPEANAISRVVVYGSVVILAAAVGLLLWVVRSSFATGVDADVEQPVPFSHAQHVGGLGLDCRYCHTSVEKSAFAGIPPTETCMTCHSQIGAEKLVPVRESQRTGVPLRWRRVHNLPDFVYFNHSIHLNKGVGCATCHGRVDTMPRIRQVNALHMSWCRDCHQMPERYLRPREQVFDMEWAPEEDQIALGRRLVKRYDIHVEPLTDCWICHR